MKLAWNSKKNWSKMWLPDTRSEQFSGDTWAQFDELLDGIDFPPAPEIVYPLHDMNLWMHLVRSLPAAKAVGPCGWSNDELRQNAAFAIW